MWIFFIVNNINFAAPNAPASTTELAHTPKMPKDTQLEELALTTNLPKNVKLPKDEEPDELAYTTELPKNAQPDKVACTPELPDKFYSSGHPTNFKGNLNIIFVYFGALLLRYITAFCLFAA